MNEATIASLTILTADYKCACCSMIDVHDESASSLHVCACVCVCCTRTVQFVLVCASNHLHKRLLVLPQLGDYISEIASNMMLVEEHILWMAQNEARACTRIVQCVERIADLALTGDNQAISKV